MERSIIKIRSMSFKYNDKYIFKDFNLDVDKASFVSIIGHNASYRTTLFKILSGMYETDGYINIDGYLLNNSFLMKTHKILSSFIDDEDYYLIGDTVREILAFPLENLNYSSKEIDILVNNIAKKFKIDNILDEKKDRLTTSLKVKTIIASLLIYNPKILILDNIFVKLTNEDKKLVIKILKEYQKENKLTVILSTNNLEDTLICDRIILLDKGKITIDNKLQEVYNDDRLEKLGFELPFIVKLSHNLLLYDLIDKTYLKESELVNKLWD